MTGLLQHVAYGVQNAQYDIKNVYSFDLVEMEMLACQMNINKFQYKCDWDRISDQFKIKGVIIDIDDKVGSIDLIEDEIYKMHLDIYSYQTDMNRNKIQNKTNWIGSIPLIIGKISYVSNSIIINLPNVFFSSSSKCFNGFLHYKFVINTPIKLKKIFLNNIVRFDDSTFRRKISLLTDIFYELNYVYIGNDISSTFNNTQLKYINHNGQIDKIIFEKKILNSKEKVLGLYMVIPIELIELIKLIESKFNESSKIIEMDNLETKGYVNLYKISFNNSLDLEPMDLISIQFEYSNNDDLNVIHEHINNICIYPIISNKLICINYNLGLKYSNGELNDEFNEKDNVTIEKYSNNINLLADNLYKNFILYGCDKIDINDCKNFILEYTN